MGQALTEREIPHAVWAQTMRGVRGIPRFAVPPADRGSEEVRVLPVFHLHGFVPRRLAVITDTEFVFSTSQYSEIYAKNDETIIDETFEKHLAKPGHVALYIGCSFNDEAMNRLLTKAARRYPGRFHFALLRWPTPRPASEPSSHEIELHATRYLNMGVQPVWYYGVEEIPGIIRSLE